MNKRSFMCWVMLLLHSSFTWHNLVVSKHICSKNSPSVILMRNALRGGRRTQQRVHVHERLHGIRSVRLCVVRIDMSVRMGRVRVCVRKRRRRDAGRSGGACYASWIDRDRRNDVGRSSERRGEGIGESDREGVRESGRVGGRRGGRK